MKAFILVALVASVAARSLDLQTINQIKQKSLLTTPELVKDDVLLKEQLKKTIVGQQQGNFIDSTVLPVDYDTTFKYNTFADRVLTIDELYTTELFQEYLRLPLFRQYIQYPAFQRFVSSVYFQRFYQLPAYKQYFVNPVLFQKYILPLVQLFTTTDYTVPTTTSVYGQEDVLGLQGLVDQVVYKQNKNVFPYATNYNNRFAVPTTTYSAKYGYDYPVYGQQETTNYNYLLNKISKNLYNVDSVKPVVAQEIKTDVKIIPQEKVVVEPISLNQVVVEEPKVVDVQVDSKVFPVDTIVPVQTESVVLTERDVLLLKELLRQQIITPEVYQAVIVGKVDYFTVLRQVVVYQGIPYDLLKDVITRLQVVDTTVVVPKTFVLNERHIVILKDLLQKDFITTEIYRDVLVGKVDFFTVIRQILERRGLNTDLITLIINRLFVVDTIVPVTTTEKDVFIVKELLRQNVITQKVYQYFVLGQVDLFSILRQVIVRRDVVDTIYPVVLTQKNIELLKELFRQQIITPEVYQAVLVQKVDFFTVLRQVLERRGLDSQLITLFINKFVQYNEQYYGQEITQEDVLLLKELLRQQLITPEIYQAVIYKKIDFYTVIRQIIFRQQEQQLIDTVVPFNRYFGGFDKFDKYDLVNKYFGGFNKNFDGYYNKYNTEVPTTYNFRDNFYNRYPTVAL